MSAEIIPFDEAGARVRQRRSETAMQASDWFWIAAVCVWPVGLALFAGQAAIEASLSAWRRR